MCCCARLFQKCPISTLQGVWRGSALWLEQNVTQLCTFYWERHNELLVLRWQILLFNKDTDEKTCKGTRQAFLDFDGCQCIKMIWYNDDLKKKKRNNEFYFQISDVITKRILFYSFFGLILVNIWLIYQVKWWF